LHGATNVVAKLYPPIPGRYAGRPQTPSFPFITRNSWGKGTAYYFAGTFFELYREHGIPHYRKIIASLTRKNSEPTVELLNAPESVEFTVRRSSRGRLIVHLVNYSGGMNRPINKIIPLRDIRLKVNISVSSVKALVRGEALAVDADGIIVLPEIKEFEVILME